MRNTHLKATRFERSRSVRDAALKLLRKDGFWRPICGLDDLFLSFDSAEFEIIHVTPFQHLPESSENFKYAAVKYGTTWEREPYWLDIWDKKTRRKVLSVRWDTSDELDIVSFRRGDWEERLLSSAE
jgi:hypothetical protein